MPLGYKSGSYTNNQRKTISNLVSQFNRATQAIGLRGFKLDTATLESRNYTKKSYTQTVNRLEGFLKSYKQGNAEKWLRQFSARATRDLTKARQKAFQIAQSQGMDKYANVMRFQTFTPKQNYFDDLQPTSLGPWLTSLFYESGREYKRWRAEIYKSSIIQIIEENWRGIVPDYLVDKYERMINKANAIKLHDAYFADPVTEIEFFYDAVYSVDTNIEVLENSYNKWVQVLYG